VAKLRQNFSVNAKVRQRINQFTHKKQKLLEQELIPPNLAFLHYQIIAAKLEYLSDKKKL